MDHVVFFPAPDGTPAFRRLASLEDAVLLVEHLRNVEGINEVSCHALTDVPLAFRTYYRVEVPAAVSEVAPEVVPAAVPAQAASVEQTLEPVPEPAAESVAVPVAAVGASAEPELAAAASGPAHDGARSLGFFA